jgi:hypothetical protein
MICRCHNLFLQTHATSYVFLRTHPTSYSFYHGLERVSTVQLLYTVKEKGGKPDRKPYPPLMA